MKVIFKKDNLIFTEKLINDLKNDLSNYYSGDMSLLEIDFSNALQEGHYGGEVDKDGAWTESCSDIIVRDTDGNVVVENGWFDFIDDPKLGVVYYWAFLHGKEVKEKSDGKIPQYLWNKMSTMGQKKYNRVKPND